MTRINLHICMILVFVFTATMGFAREFIIFSIAQDISMGEPGEVTKKNYYVNMGLQQGVDKGADLDVYRIISVNDPYETKKRHNYRVKIGELTVLHAEQSSAITVFKSLNQGDAFPMYELDSFMIGDRVNVNLE